jgi:pimeloyl-ACP methyl ester carboxylesterase
MKTESKFIETNGIRLHYLEQGTEGPVLLLMHGLTANAHAFDGLIKAGLSDSFRVLSVDLRGRGLSSSPDKGYTMKEHADDIIGMLGALNIREVIVAGHSFGGFLGLYLTVHFPENFSRLIMLDAAVNMHPQTKEMLAPALSRLDRVFPSFDDYLDKVKQAPYLTFWDEAMWSYYRADVQDLPNGTVVARSRLENMMEAVLKGSLGEPWEELIGKLNKPVMLINALGIYTMGNALLPRELARETADMINNCRYVEVAGNHQTMLYGEGAVQIVESIQQFILQ